MASAGKAFSVTVLFYCPFSFFFRENRKKVVVCSRSSLFVALWRYIFLYLKVKLRRKYRIFWFFIPCSGDFSDCCVVCIEKRNVKKCSACKMVGDVHSLPASLYPLNNR